MPSPDEKDPLDDLAEANPERYIRLSKPFESVGLMNDALAGFFREVGALREKYKIPDLLIAAMGKAINDTGLPEDRIATMQYGDMGLRPTIVLHLYREQGPMIQALMESMSPGPVVRPKSP